MIIPEIPSNEKKRLKALHSYQVLDTEFEESYDNLVKLASEIFDAPVSFISLIDKDRQWFKSQLGIKPRELPRSESFCGHTILKPQEPMVIEDARKDKRFWDNPNVIKKINPIIFYVGVPILSNEGLPLGSLCVVDHKPKKVKKFQLNALKTLAKQVEKLFDLHKSKIEIKENHLALSNHLIELKTYQKALNEAVIFAITNHKGEFIHINDRFTEISGFSKDELLGNGFELIDTTLFGSNFWRDVNDTLNKGIVWKGRVKYRKKSGESYWVKSTVIPFQQSEQEPPTEFFHIQKDITELVKNEQSRVNEVIYHHEKKYAGISDNLREGIAQSMAGLSFHLTSIESHIKSGKSIHADNIIALKDILKEMMEETNNLAFDIMPHSLMKSGVRDALHSLFNRLSNDFDAEINFIDENLKCYPIVKSAEIQIYRAIANIYEKAIERSKKLRSSFQLLSEPKVGFELRIEQNDINNTEDAEKITPIIDSIAKQVQLVDGEFTVNYENNKKAFNIRVVLPQEFTQNATSTEANMF